MIPVGPGPLNLHGSVLGWATVQGNDKVHFFLPIENSSTCSRRVLFLFRKRSSVYNFSVIKFFRTDYSCLECSKKNDDGSDLYRT